MSKIICPLVLAAFLAISTAHAERMGTNPKPHGRPSFLASVEEAIAALFR